MSAFKFYLSVPKNAVEYTDFLDITDYVIESDVGNLSLNLASNEYDIGSIKFNKISVNLNNVSAKFSRAGNVLSLFTFKRDEAILKIEWDRNVNTISCGSFPCGLTYLSEPIEIYKGFLEDNSSKFDSDNQIQKFNFLGQSSLIGKTPVDFASLSNGILVNDAIFNILNQDKIKKIFDS